MMEITFVQQQAGASAKRKRFNQACERCRKRKKRCIHTDGNQAHGPESDQSSPSVHSRPDTSRSENDASDHLINQNDTPRSHFAEVVKTVTPSSQGANPKTQSQTDEIISQNQLNISRSSVPKRFVGDLNPEAVLLDRTSDGNARHQRGEIGVWLVGSAVHSEDETPRGTTESRSPMNRPLNHGINGTSSSNVLQPADKAALIDIYFSRIHPLLPILDEPEFRQGLRESSIPDTLIRAVCLVASKDDRARGFLRIGPASSTLMETREFSKAIYNTILNDLRSDLRLDKISLIRTLALVSLHSEGSDGAEEASIHLAQAIHHSQSIGIHLGRPSRSQNLEAMNKLFWSLWGLDKLNAATNGRPVMINDQDLGIAAFVPRTPSDRPFDIWLKLATMLSKVISLYRPTASPDATGWEDEFPGFEDMIEDQNSEPIVPSILITLHLFYFIVAMLSSRSKSISDAHYSKPSRTRQSLAAVQTIAFMCGDNKPDLLPLPLVPYGISLALSVAYKSMRRIQLPHQQAQAKLDFKRCCKTLDSLKHTWWSADIMTALAHKVLGEVEKTSDPRANPPKPISRHFRNSLLSPHSLVQDNLTQSGVDTPSASAGQQHGDSQSAGTNHIPGQPELYTNLKISILSSGLILILIFH